MINFFQKILANHQKSSHHVKRQSLGLLPFFFRMGQSVQSHGKMDQNSHGMDMMDDAHIPSTQPGYDIASSPW